MTLMARSKAKHNKGPAKHKAKLKPKGSAAANRKGQKRKQARGGDAMDAKLTQPGEVVSNSA